MPVFFLRKNLHLALANGLALTLRSLRRAFSRDLCNAPKRAGIDTSRKTVFQSVPMESTRTGKMAKPNDLGTVAKQRREAGSAPAPLQGVATVC